MARGRREPALSRGEGAVARGDQTEVHEGWSGRGSRRWHIADWRRSSRIAPSSSRLRRRARRRSARPSSPPRPRRGSPCGRRTRVPFRRDEILQGVGQKLGLAPEKVAESRSRPQDENLLDFKDLGRAVDRVALAKVRPLAVSPGGGRGPGEKPAVSPTLPPDQVPPAARQGRGVDMDEGYAIGIDGPLSLFSIRPSYGLQMAAVPAGGAALPRLRSSPSHVGPGAAEASSSTPTTGSSRTTRAWTTAPRPGRVHRRFRQVRRRGRSRRRPTSTGRGGLGAGLSIRSQSTGIDVLAEVVGFWKQPASTGCSGSCRSTGRPAICSRSPRG